MVDGDSLCLEGESIPIRLFGVDAPERGDEGFQSSTDYLRALALGRPLRCNELCRDKYRRSIGRCYPSGGREINRLMLEEPFTVEYCRYSKNAYGACK